MKNAARTLPRRVLEHVRTSALWAPGDSVAVSVSGGVDSMVLLHVLHRTQAAHGGELMVVTMDHGLRPESTEEVRSVAALSRDLGLPCEVIHLGIESGSNLAERARDARRDALLQFQTDRIATGHHEGDQAETVLYHLLRGSGARGLRGMQPKVGVWVRPLLREPRSVLKEWAEMESISWFEDPSNADSQRGALRALMPTLDGIQGGASRALARSARLLSREDDYLSEQVQYLWSEISVGDGLKRSLLATLHPALQLRLLRQLIGDARVRAEPLESIVDGALVDAGKLDLGYGLRFTCDGELLRVEKT